MLALAVSCETMYGPVQTPIASDEKKADGVEITVTEAKDESVIFTLAPKAESAYYSYMVHQANEAVEVDAQSLYSGAYKGKAGVVKTGSFKWTAETAVSTVAVNGLNPNTTYQIYAVAATPMGFVGQVANASFKTSDTVAPAYNDYETSENEVTFYFSENVKRNAEAGAIKVAYYAPYSQEFNTEAAAAGEVNVPEDAIVVSGSEATITVPGLPTGCYWTIAIPEGAFVDAVGQNLPGYSSTMQMVDSEDGQVPYPTGFYGEVSYVELPMLDDVELEVISKWDAPILIPLVNEYAIANYSSRKFVTVTYTVATSTSTQTTVHTLAPGKTYGITQSGFAVMLPEKPLNGAIVTVSVPAGCIYDVFGNDSEAIELSFKYSEIEYTLADIVGTYSMTEESLLYKKEYVTAMVIKESNDPEKGNVMITTYNDFECLIPIYANFNTKTGALSVPSQQIFTSVPLDETTSGYLMFVSYTLSAEGKVGISKEPVVFNLTAPHVISGANNYYGPLILDSEGNVLELYNLYNPQSTVAELSSGEIETTAKPFVMRSAPLHTIVKRF